MKGQQAFRHAETTEWFQDLKNDWVCTVRLFFRVKSHDGTFGPFQEIGKEARISGKTWTEFRR